VNSTNAAILLQSPRCRRDTGCAAPRPDAHHKAERRDSSPGSAPALYACSLRTGSSDRVCWRSVCDRPRDVRGTPLLPLTRFRDGTARMVTHRSSRSMSVRRCGRRRARSTDTSTVSSRSSQQRSSVSRRCGSRNSSPSWSAIRNEPSSMDSGSRNTRRHPGGGKGSLDDPD